MQVVVYAVKEALAQVHVTDRVDAFREVHTTRNLTISVRPVMLDSFHVPLIDDYDDLLTLRIVYLLE